MMRTAAGVAFLSFVSAVQSFSAPTTELLWPKGAPGAVGEEDRDRPSLTFYLAEKGKSNGTSIVVCPGGGYGALAMDHEGKQIAEWLNGLGISAFVLKYRLGPRYHHPAPLQDVQRAIRIVRSRNAELGIASERIGVWGFSAGGHLASSAITHFSGGDAGSADGIERASSRPDFAVLAYPVITFTQEEFMHKGSRRNLLGEPPDPKLVEYLSSELQVKKDTPPTFLFHTNEDSGVPPENSILFYLALRRAGIPVEMPIFEKGKHGVGLAQADPILSAWANRLSDWFRTRGLIPAAK